MRLSLLALLVAGCSSFGADAPEPDGGAASDDGGTVPHGADGGAADAASPGSFCATTDKTDLVFCDDFESSPAASPFGWTSAQKPRAGDTMELLPSGGREGNAALHFVVGIPSNASANTWLTKTIADGAADIASSTRFELELSFKVAAAAGDYAVLAGFVFDDLAEAHGLVVRQRESAVGGSQPTTKTVEIAPGWHRARVVFEKAAAAGFTRTVTVDDQDAGSTSVSLTGALRARVVLGVYYSSWASAAGQKVDVTFDDVAARIQK